MSLVVLLGRGIGYSASPAIHAAAFAALGLPHRYELRDVAPDALAVAVGALRDGGHLGANVTQPHKVAVSDLVDDVAPEVARLGAANTIVARDGRLAAHNTDLAAIAHELGRLGPAPGPGAVVLGAGGAARAVAAALDDAGWTGTTLVTRDRWPSLAALLRDARLLVNATPIGTADPASLPVPAACLRPDLPVLDLVYRPSPTRLVREARERGAPALGGAGTLLRQAAASFTLWTGAAPPLDAMRVALEGELGDGTDA